MDYISILVSWNSENQVKPHNSLDFSPFKKDYLPNTLWKNSFLSKPPPIDMFSSSIFLPNLKGYKPVYLSLASTLWTSCGEEGWWDLLPN